MAGALVSALIGQMTSITLQEAKQEIKLVVGVDEEIRRLEGNLRTILAVLDDAEKRQVQDKAVKLWLDNLKEASYEMDNVLDEWNTAMIKLEIEKEEEHENDDNTSVLKKKKKNKVCSFIPSPSRCFSQVNKLVLRHDIAHKIKELNVRLDEVVKKRVEYGFELTRGPEGVVRPKTTSFIDVCEICGRDTEKDDLVSYILGKGCQKERSPHVISLVGMGGIGKTTLAQLAYNHYDVQAHFEERMWICVSEPFDQCKIAKSIIEVVGGESSNTIELQNLLQNICELIGKKRFFLVLDDVWTEDSTTWEPFRLALKNGAQGSTILVTTRNEKVAKMMRSAHTINLGILCDENCWLIFSTIAFIDEDLGQQKQLEDLGKEIAKKCKGLPLAAKTLGSLMRFKRSREQWEGVLHSCLWDLEDVERGLFAPLLLSYYDLSSPMKRCFSYCAIFPKDYIFYREQLVFHWMAQGYIKSMANMEMEIIAEEYFENLVVRSFFQDLEKCEDDGKIISCKMHDIVHDFAQLMTTNECFAIDGDKKGEIDCRSAHHLLLDNPEHTKFPMYIYNAKNLRTLVVRSKVDNLDIFLTELLGHFKWLRTLILRCPIKKLPNVVGNLIHLRFILLDISDDIEELPESICNLCNLQTLYVKRCRCLKKLPQGMGKLINLRHLFLGLNNSIGSFPRGISRLSSLRTLSHFKICGKNDSGGSKLKELKNLNQIGESLGITGLGNMVDVREVENAQFKKKIRLRQLYLTFNVKDVDVDEDDRRMENDVLVLNALEPHPDLELLHIYFYQGTTLYFNWMISLSKLKNLYLGSCIKLERLPLLGKLPLLESLRIHESIKLKLGAEFLGIESRNKNKKDDIIIFPKLKYLEIRGLQEWEEWIEIGEMRQEGEEDDYCFTIMPCIHFLQICRCPKLKSLPNFLRTTSLKHLDISWCPLLSERCQRGIGEDWPKISHIPNIIDWMNMQRDGCEGKSCYSDISSSSSSSKLEEVDDKDDVCKGYRLSEGEEDGSEYEEDKEDEDAQVNNDKGDLQSWRV